MDAYADACLHANPLQFDEEKHEYRLRGKVLPSVTQIIKAILPPQYEFAGEWHMQRGAATHKACELFDQGVLDWASVDPEIEPRVKAWQRFRSDWPAEIVANETRLAHEGLRYAGTIDRMFRHQGKLVLADIKNSVAQQVRLQLGLYSLAWTATKLTKVDRAVAVELLENGSYKCHWFLPSELRQAERQGVALKAVYDFAEQHGLLKGKE